MFVPKPRRQENVCFLNRKAPPERSVNAGCIIKKRKPIEWLLVRDRPSSPIAGVGVRVFLSSVENKTNKQTNACCIILGFGIQVG